MKKNTLKVVRERRRIWCFKNDFSPCPLHTHSLGSYHILLMSTIWWFRVDDDFMWCHLLFLMIKMLASSVLISPEYFQPQFLPKINASNMDTLSAFFKLCFIAHWMPRNHIILPRCCYVSRVHYQPTRSWFLSKKKVKFYVFVCEVYKNQRSCASSRVRNRVVFIFFHSPFILLATTMTTSTLVKYRSPEFNRMCCFFNYCLYLLLLLFPPSHINF